MIEHLFSDLPKVAGVEAVVIFENNNRVLDKWMTPNFNVQILKDLGLQCRQIFSLNQKTDLRFNELVLSYEKGQVFCRFHPDFLIIVAAKLKVETALLRLIINVGINDYAGSKKWQKIVHKNLPAAGNFLTSDLLDDVEREYLTKLSEYPAKE